PGDAIANSVVQKTRLGLEKENNKDDKRIDVLEWPTAEWIPVGQIVTTFDIDIIDQPCPINIGATITITSSLSLLNNLIQVIGEVQHYFCQGDVSLCAAAGFGVAVLPVVLVIAAEVYEPDFKEFMGEGTPSECEWVEPPPDGDDTHKTIACTY